MWSQRIVSCYAVIISHTMSFFAQLQPRPDQNVGFGAVEIECNAQVSCL